MLGRYNGKPFVCISKSGGQNLWLPFMLERGLKVLHPKGFSGTLEKAKTHYEAQSLLAEHNLAPTPLEMLKIKLYFVKCSEKMHPWNCYGIIMERVQNGGTDQILKNLERFGVDNNQKTKLIIDYYRRSADALTLMDYTVLCRFFGVSEEQRLNEIIDEIKNRLPSSFNEGPDLLTPTNIVLNENGEAKVIDCDLSSI